MKGDKTAPNKRGKSVPQKLDLPAYRYLRGYALDPGFSARLETRRISQVVYRIPFESVEPGPDGEYVEVMDFDPASKCWYEPVDLTQEAVASQQGLEPSEGNPQFHQQFVYTVIMKTIWHFERALGRKVIWFPRREFKKGKLEEHYVQKLRVYPHGFRDANAYYDSDKSALLFGYFNAAHESQGANYPGGVVFTCLSPDIVAHEATHAILDSIHRRYMEDTNPDVPAFHEGFADIVALLQRFTFIDLVEHQLAATRGDLSKFSVLGELATQFGEALAGNRGALRSMIGRWEGNKWQPLKPDPSDYKLHTEAHDRGAVLVATVFDAFQRIYNFRSADLLRIATGGKGGAMDGEISTDLVRRLAAEASAIAEHLLHICIRALDYCPPIDISFGSYLRALITADLDIAPEDENGYRLALMEAFRARGIFPHRVNTFSIESLRWDRPDFTPKEEEAIKWITGEIKPFVRELADTKCRKTLFDHSIEARRHLWTLLMGKQQVFLADSEWESFLNKLGLTARPVSVLFGKDSDVVEFLDEHGKVNRNFVPKIEVHTLRPAFRAGREGRQIEQLVVTLTQRVRTNVAPISRASGKKKVRPMVFRGGCTIILSLGELNQVEYIVVKNITSYRRFVEQAKYFNGDDECSVNLAESMYADGYRERRINFNLLHRH